MRRDDVGAMNRRSCRIASAPRRPGVAIAGLLVAFVLSAATRADPDHYADSDFDRVAKIDTHVHLYGEVPVFLARAKADGFRLLTISVNYADFPPLAEQLRSAVALRKAYPSEVAFAATFDANGSDRPEWAARTLTQLDEALAQGAVAVKVWKDIGMQLRDPDGHVVMIDDERFAPIFRALVERDVVVLGHQGEPRNAWLPLDEMTVKGDRDYFAEHPQYHMYRHPEWPSYEAQIAARDRLLDRYPRMRFVGVHLASLEWDVDRIAAFLDRYPAASVDLAARLVHLERQAVANRDKVRAFLIKYQDRVLYGTDISRGRDQSDAELASEAHAAWLADWRFLAGDSQMKSGDFDGAFTGLALPKPVIDKIYRDNARTLFPQAWPEPGAP
jgi:predicted TIM-barrel fold metal-dependent hydrolase